MPKSGAGQVARKKASTKKGGPSAGVSGSSKMQLDDILSTLLPMDSGGKGKGRIGEVVEGEESGRSRKKVKVPTSATAKESRDAEAEATMEKSKYKGGTQAGNEVKEREKIKSGIEVQSKVKDKAKGVSALDLLTATSTCSRLTMNPASRSYTSQDLSTSATTSANDTHAVLGSSSTSSTLTVGARLLRPHTQFQLEGDVGVQLKTYKASFRTLLSALQLLERETELVERIWYKNASQFQSALWWQAFNSVRRTLHPLFRTSTSNAKSMVRNLTLVYAGLGGGISTFQLALQTQSQAEGWGALTKFDTKPSSELLHTFLSFPPATQLLTLTQDHLAQLQKILLLLTTRIESAGKVLVNHLNTPPAPTFAPLISTLLALLASIDSAAQSALHTQNPKSSQSHSTWHQLHQGPVQTLKHMLHHLLAPLE